MEGHLIGDGPLLIFDTVLSSAKRKIKWLMHEEKKDSLESKLYGIDALTRAKTSTVLKGSAQGPLKCWKSVGTARTLRLYLAFGLRARLKTKIPDHQGES